MYPYLHEIFADRKGDTVFSCFGIWHILYMAVIFGTILLTVLLLRNREEKCRQKAIKDSTFATTI